MGQKRRFVGQGNAGVDVEHMRAGGNLRAGFFLHPSKIAGRHFGGQQLAAGGIDALADDAERVIETDPNFAAGGMQDGGGHGTPFCQVMRRAAGPPSGSVAQRRA